MGWKARIVLLAGEALLLSRRNDAAILDEGSRTVMVEGGDAEQSHGTSFRCRSEHRVDERRDRRSLSQDQEPAKNQQHEQDRQQPPFLARAHIGEQLAS